MGSYEPFHVETTSERVAGATVSFGASVLGLLGILGMLQGFAAILGNDIFATGVDYVFAFGLTAWGWIHLLLGALTFAIALGLAMLQPWARVGGICVGAISIIANFAFLPYYPMWAVTVIAFSVLTIWALSVQIAAVRHATT